MQNDSQQEKFFTKPLIVIFLTILIDLIGFGIVIPLLTFYAEADEFRATPFDVGMLVASYSLMQFIFSPILGGLSDRYGRRPVLFISIVGAGIGYLTVGLASSLWMIYLGRIIGGVTAGNLSTAQAYIADVTTRENRAKGMGLFGMAFGLGFILGPALAGVLSKFGVHVPFYFAAALSFFNAGLLLFLLPETRREGPPQVQRRSRFAELAEVFRDKRFSTITLQYFLLVTAFSMMTTSFAYYTGFKFGYGAEQTGYVLAYVGFLAIVMQGGLFARLAKRFGETKLVVFGCLMLVLSLFAVPFIGADFGGLGGLLIGSAFFSLGNSLASPSLTSLASKNAAEHEQGRTLGMLQSAASLARVIGPALCAVLLNTAVGGVTQSSLTRNFWTASAIMAVAMIVGIYYNSTHRTEN